MKTLKYFLSCLVCLSLFSCERDLLNEEQYKKVVYALSYDNNIFPYAYELKQEATMGYITLYCSGTLPAEEDFTIEMEDYPAMLDEYNKRIFDLDVSKYAQPLPADRYEIPSYSCEFKSGGEDSYTLFPIKVNANGLSPDTAYMIPMNIKSVSHYEINPNKQQILFQIKLKNEYANQQERTSYSMKGRKNGDPLTAVKEFTPLTHNRVRIIPEALAGESNIDFINKYAIILEIQEDNTVNILPFKDIVVEKTDICTYNPDLKVFNIYYKYKSDSDTWIEVSEELTRIVSEVE